jgi:hypothetical protein
MTGSFVALARRAYACLRALVKRIGSFIMKYPVAILTLGVLGLVAVLAAMAGRSFPVGDIMQRLFGKGSPGKPSERNDVPDDRRDNGGTPIQPGKSDKEGFTQSPAIDGIRDPGLFDDGKKVVLEEPGEKPVEVVLPTGVEDEDVLEVILVNPDGREVANHDSGVDTTEMKDWLRKR